MAKKLYFSLIKCQRCPEQWVIKTDRWNLTAIIERRKLELRLIAHSHLHIMEMSHEKTS